MATRLTTTSHLILAMLAVRDWSAYELAEQAGVGLADLWFGETRQRYEAPKRLVEMGLATARTEPADGSRTRTVYAITDEGRQALKAWLALPPRPLSIRFEGMVQVLMTDQGTLADLRQTLETIAADAQEGLDRYAAMAARLIDNGGLSPQRLHAVALPMRFLTQHFGTILDWTDWALAEIETWDDTVSPGTELKDRSIAIFEEVLADHAARQQRRAARGSSQG